MQRGAIVLCGGRSTRMGMPKAMLPFGPELMLQRVVRLVGEAACPVAVVAAPGQGLPPLPPGVLTVRDRSEGRGPLEGLAVGLAALEGRADAVYATGCDVPGLSPALVGRMFELLDDHEIAVAREGKYYHPLAAVYRPGVVRRIEQLLAEGRMRPVFLFELADTLDVRVEALRQVDPTLASLENLNRPEDYLAALKRAGFEPPAGVVARFESREGEAPPEPK
jgi:molybdopterin-guanine dinucleotide biosynthesis protein A